MTKRWVVAGSTGMLGTDLLGALAETGRLVTVLRRPELDVSLSIESLRRLIGDGHVVVNCVAYTAVDRAEDEPEEAFRINAKFAGNLAEAARSVGAKFIHISTDYVFSGDSDESYGINDKPGPRSVYGASKLAGEIEVLSRNEDASIFRTAWLYGKSGKSFPQKILSRLNQGVHLDVVNDQVGSPTWTKDLASLILRHHQARYWPTIVHGVSSGSCSWFEFAREIAIAAGRTPDLVRPISSEEYRTNAPRPRLSVLKTEPSPVLPIGNWRQRWRAAAPEFLST